MPSRRHQIDLPHRIHQKPGLGKLLPFATEKKQVSPWKSMGKNENLHRGHRGLKRGRVTNFCRRFFFPNPCEFTISICTKDGSKAFCSRTHRPLLHEHSISLALWLATRDPGVFCLLPVSRSLAASNTCIIRDQILRYSSIHSHPQTKPWTSNNETLHQKWQKQSKIPNTWPKTQILSCSTKFPLANLLPSYHPWSSKPVRS